MPLKNPAGCLPRVSDKAYVSESAVIIGNMEIKKDVYIAPNTTIRADESRSAKGVAKSIIPMPIDFNPKSVY